MLEREVMFDTSRAWTTKQFVGFLALLCASGLLLHAAKRPEASNNDFCKDEQGQMSFAQLSGGKSFCPPGQTLVTVIFKHDNE